VFVLRAFLDMKHLLEDEDEDENFDDLGVLPRLHKRDEEPKKDVKEVTFLSFFCPLQLTLACERVQTTQVSPEAEAVAPAPERKALIVAPVVAPVVADDADLNGPSVTLYHLNGYTFGARGVSKVCLVVVVCVCVCDLLFCDSTAGASNISRQDDSPQTTL
jgi:hypothetical protein